MGEPTAPMRCPECDGEGAMLDENLGIWEHCLACDGEGYVETKESDDE